VSWLPAMVRPEAISTIVLAFVAATGLAQSVTPEQASPKEIIEDFCRIDAEGVRLTPDGWAKAAAWFARPSPPPRELQFEVFEGNVFVGDAAVKGDTAEVGVEYLELGQVDSALRFKLAMPDGAVKTRAFYRLVLAAPRGRSVGGNGTGVTGPPEWKIEGSEPQPLVTVSTALRYLTQMRGETRDPRATKNADRSIAALKRIGRARCAPPPAPRTP